MPEERYGIVENFMVWVVYLKFCGQDHDIGNFEARNEAADACARAVKEITQALAYGRAARRMFGDHAVCHFPYLLNQPAGNVLGQKQLEQEWNQLLTSSDLVSSSSPCAGRIEGRERWRAVLGYKGQLILLGIFHTKVEGKEQLKYCFNQDFSRPPLCRHSSGGGHASISKGSQQKSEVRGYCTIQ
jgi:hypothetical protein